MAKPRWLDDKELTRKGQGGLAERRVRQTFASGAFWHDKGDIETMEYLVDTKATKHRSFSVTLQDWYKIAKEARQKKKVPALVIEFGEELALVVITLGEFDALRRMVEKGGINGT